MNSQYDPPLSNDYQLDYFVGYLPIGATSTYYSLETGINSRLFY